MKLAGLPVNLFFLPIYFAQGNYVRLVTPRLPDASGPTEGICPGLEPALRLIVIGDSTVAGIGAATHEYAITGRLAHHLSQATKRTVNWRAVGQTHATIPVLRQRILPQLKKERADLIAFSIGINDTTRLYSPEQWEANLRGMLADLRAQFGAIPVVHAGLPPLEEFPALPRPLRTWLAARLRRFADIARQVMAEDGNGYFLCLPPALAQLDFADDGYHPSESAYDLWGTELTNYLMNHLSTKLNSRA